MIDYPGVDPVLLETADRLFAACCDNRQLLAAEEAGWAKDLWERAAEMGLPWISVPEDRGGSGGGLPEALAVLRVAGRHGAPIPLAETGVLAGWLLAGAGLPVDPASPLTVVPGRDGDTLRLDGGPGPDARLTGTAHRVPWARAAARIVALVGSDDGWQVVAVPTADVGVRVEPDVNLAGEPRDTVHLDGVEPAVLAPAAAGVDPDALVRRGALARVMTMAGALEAMSELTLAYAHQRRQFGRPVATFQAVQQHLVVVAQEAAVVTMAATVAATATARADERAGGGGGSSSSGRDGAFEVAAAKLLANQAAHTATRAAHQVHGAIGMTQEYPLHQLSRRLWSWRKEYGDDRYWTVRLGPLIGAAGADGLYPLIAGG
ncbi:acyl-CoA dehydrogenase family protein [Frankia sp. Cas3]|uniref:acyl-CoA dehydrogenase family protein n=1 Tax=Frankia sp. Cas3 TaxID=3073926 RepID=UPI002AD37048|nr:acyl-CoA dehydrogenase family protein [Frankia sp. Cas3]